MKWEVYEALEGARSSSGGLREAEEARVGSDGATVSSASLWLSKILSLLPLDDALGMVLLLSASHSVTD